MGTERIKAISRNQGEGKRKGKEKIKGGEQRMGRREQIQNRCTGRTNETRRGWLLLLLHMKGDVRAYRKKTESSVSIKRTGDTSVQAVCLTSVTCNLRIPLYPSY